jgi:hypothetical protein
MAQPGMIDPFFYTAYSQNGPELIARYGTGNYYWVRVGFILPARITYLLFGALPGFFALRYVLALLAIVPPYLLCRRLYGIPAGWAAVAAILVSPPILTAWSTDYPDSSAVSYLLAGTACLVMPSRHRSVFVAAAGALFALAVHSQVVAALVVLGAVAAYIIAFAQDARTVAWHLLLLGAASVAVTGLLILGSWAFLGAPDILTPTKAAVHRLNDPAALAIFRSHNYHWFRYEFYLLAPPVLAAAWLGLRWRDQPSREEKALVLGVALAYLGYTAEQFGGRSWAMEYYLWSSLLFPGAALVLSIVVVVASKPFFPRLAPVLVVLPLALLPLRDVIGMQIPAVLSLAAALLVAAVVARIGTAPVRLVAAASIAALAFGLMALTRPAPPGATLYPVPDYAHAIWGGEQQTIDEYDVATQLKTVVPSVREEPGTLQLWWTPRFSETVNKSAAQYLWFADNGLPNTMPELTSSEATTLATVRPRWLVLLSADGKEFDAAQDQLARRGFQPKTWRNRVLISGSAQLHVRVLELTAYQVPLND